LSSRGEGFRGSIGKDHKVLKEVINRYIKNALKGKPLRLASEEMALLKSLEKS
jgi:hypothetical protein